MRGRFETANGAGQVSGLALWSLEEGLRGALADGELKRPQ